MWTAKILDKNVVDGDVVVRVGYTSETATSEDTFRLNIDTIGLFENMIAAKVQRLNTADDLLARVTLGHIDVSAKVDALDAEQAKTTAAIDTTIN